jgi:hypothetical protein
MRALHLVAIGLLSSSAAREITFQPVSGFADQQLLGHGGDIDVTGSAFAGLTTYANLPYVHCLAGAGKHVDKFDIAILGAPFDTVSETLSLQFRVVEVTDHMCLDRKMPLLVLVKGPSGTARTVSPWYATQTTLDLERVNTRYAGYEFRYHFMILPECA